MNEPTPSTDTPATTLMPGSVIDYMRDRLAALEAFQGVLSEAGRKADEEEISALRKGLAYADNGTLGMVDTSATPASKMAALSTARAQDKAALEEKDAEIVSLTQQRDVFRECNIEQRDREIITLRERVYELEKMRKHLISDSCEDDTAIREICGRHNIVTDDGSGYNIPLVECVEELENEVARLKAEVENVLSCFGDDAKLVKDGAVSLFALTALTLRERDDLLTRLAQAVKERDEAKDATVRARRVAETRYDCHAGPGTTQEACGACLTCVMRARDRAEQQLKEANERLFRAGDEPLAILGFAEQRLAFTARELSQVQDSRTAIILERDRAEQRVRELEAIEKTVSNELRECVRASSCPDGTDLVAWVGQLAEDKRRVDWLARNITGARRLFSFRDQENDIAALRSAIDAARKVNE